tara:strand:+ start:17857 stop:19323 length:1467 start_codon:yes stop_codon:yes gene_type:complete
MADSSIKLGVKHIRATAIAGALVAATMSSSAIAGESAHDLASRLRAESVNSAASTTNASHTNHTRRAGFDRRALAYQPTTTEPGWFVERADNSSLRISVLSQTRYTYSQRDPGFIPGGTEQTTGFSLPRTRVAFDGAIVSSQFNYRLSFDFGDAELSRGRGRAIAPFLAGSTGAPRLLDAYAQYNFAGKREGFYLKFGQFQSTILTEEAIASEYQLAVDRSMVSEFLGPGYTQGIALGRVRDNFAWEASITDGGRYVGSRETDNTAFNSVSEADFAFGVRADYKLQGSWDQFADFTSFQGSNPGTKFGAGLLYQFHGQTNPGGQVPGFVGLDAESTQAFTWTLDYQHEGDGWNFFAAYVGQWVDWEFDRTTLGILQNAFVFQGGYFLTDRVEVFGRFETFWVDKLFRNGFGTPDGYIHRFATVGVNRYILPESHAAKLTFDASYSFDSTFAITVGADDTLVLPDPSVTGFMGLTPHEFVLRAQLQIMF